MLTVFAQVDMTGQLQQQDNHEVMFHAIWGNMLMATRGNAWNAL